MRCVALYGLAGHSGEITRPLRRIYYASKRDFGSLKYYVNISKIAVKNNIIILICPALRVRVTRISMHRVGCKYLSYTIRIQTRTWFSFSVSREQPADNVTLPSQQKTWKAITHTTITSTNMYELHTILTFCVYLCEFM